MRNASVVQVVGQIKIEEGRRVVRREWPNDGNVANDRVSKEWVKVVTDNERQKRIEHATTVAEQMMRGGRRGSVAVSYTHLTLPTIYSV